MNVIPTAIAASSATEAGVSAELGAGTAAASAALVGVTPMAVDADSAQFAAALNAAGAAYVASAAEHVAQRGMYSGAQSLAGLTYDATEALRAAAAAL
ncbi:PE family protein [Mycolicibacterium litorale]|nr:PE family protein [Mycolicibacterium litorale]